MGGDRWVPVRIDRLTDEDLAQDQCKPPGHHDASEYANSHAEGRCREEMVKEQQDGDLGQCQSSREHECRSEESLKKLSTNDSAKGLLDIPSGS